MAEKILKTRIQLRYDSLANWTKNDPILKAGEIAIATIPAAAPANKQLPPVMFKVGNGTSKFSELDWASALAADVYNWAKASARPTYKYGDSDLTGFGSAATKNIGDFDANGAAAAAETNAKAYVDGKIAAIPAQAEYTLETGATDGSLILKKDGAAVGNPAVVKGWADLISSIAAKYTKPEGGIPKADLEQAVQTSLGKADTALQSHQTITTGTANGTIAVAGKNVAVKGLAALAYKASLDKADVGLGNVENKALDSAVTADSGNYVTSGAVKSYVDSAVGAVKQFQYEVINKLPTASASTMGKIYLVAHTHGNQDIYDEFITIESGATTKTYSWEKIGNTDIDLTGYVPTSRKVNNKALTADINLSAADVGVTEAAFPGLKKVGTVTGIKMNGTAQTVAADGNVDLGVILTDANAFDAAGAATSAVNAHNASTSAHEDIRTEIGKKQNIINASNKLSADFVSGLGAAAKKGVASSVTAAGTDLPTAAAVATYVGGEIGKINIPTVNNAALKDTSGQTIFTADASEDVTITVIDCGDSTANW